MNRHPSISDRSHQNGSAQDQPRSNGPTTNGSTTLHAASAATRAELLSKFQTSSDRSNSVSEGDQYRRSSVTRPSANPTKTNSRAYADSMEYAGVLLNTASPVPIPNTPSSLLPYVKPTAAERFDDSGPYKADMMARMEQLNRGDRVQPPCDRCRRLHMDCLKNLTACMGCTKKHAKCSWKDVEEQELRDHPFVLRVKTADEMAAEAASEGEGSRSGGSRSRRDVARRAQKRERMEVRDEELLGEDSPDEDVEMKDKPIENSNYLSTRNQSPPVATAVSTVAHAANGDSTSMDMIESIPTTVTLVELPFTTPSEPSQSSYPAPQAQMRRSSTDASIPEPETNGHLQTEYERDIYTQLNEATRGAITKHEPSDVSIPSNEPLVRVYTAGSDPVEPSGVSPVSPMQLDGSSTQEPARDVPVEQQPQPRSQPQDRQPQIEINHHSPELKDASPPVCQESYESKSRQMPSRPLSGIPSQAPPPPPQSSTPVLEQVVVGQGVQI